MKEVRGHIFKFQYSWEVGQGCYPEIVGVDFPGDTFRVIRDKQNAGYRTKHVILEIYDEMAEAIRTGKPSQTRIDPPPADPRCCHPPREGGSS